MTMPDSQNTVSLEFEWVDWDALTDAFGFAFVPLHSDETHGMTIDELLDEDDR